MIEDTQATENLVPNSSLKPKTESSEDVVPLVAESGLQMPGSSPPQSRGPQPGTWLGGLEELFWSGDRAWWHSVDGRTCILWMGK